MKPIKVLFVCMGNICRSPTAEGVFRKMVQDQGLEQKILIDSAGTHSYHVGSPPDNRAQAAARDRGVDLSQLRGRQFTVQDFADFDYIMVMDKSNQRDVLSLRDSEQGGTVKLFLEYAEKADIQEVPDPYYGGNRGFEHVLDLIEDASSGLLSHIQANDL
jgi:protein-tyrosine phosphatase